MSAVAPHVLPPSEELPLFVHGALVTGFRNHEKLLAPYIKETRPAYIEVVSLWHIKEAGYPVVVAATGMVKGEFVILKDFTTAMPELGRLEGYTRGPHESTYVRLIKPVADSETGEETDAHVYCHNRSLAEISGPIAEIPCGDWRAFMDEETLHEGMQVLGDQKARSRTRMTLQVCQTAVKRHSQAATPATEL